MKIDLPLSKL